jgi:hypothetical protein
VKRIGRLAHEERGTTLAELVVGMGAGLMVLVGLTTLIMVTINTTSRVSARVHATQEARLTLTRVMDQLHSACIAPKLAPIRAESSGNELRFVHATGSAVSPVPTLSKITYSNGTLTQRDYAWKSGTAPFWEFKEDTPSRTVLLSSHIAPISGVPLFSYYGYAAGAVSATPLAEPLSVTAAGETIQVTVSFMGLPGRGGSNDATPARMQGSASMRLTASSYNPTAPSRPCQ